MIDLFLIAIPAATGLLIFLISRERWRPWVLFLGSSLHAALVAACWIDLPPPALNAWLRLDELGLIVITIASAMVLVCSLYCLEYLRLRADRDNRLFAACLSWILASASLVALSRHLGLLWIGMEAATLAGAPLIHFNRNKKSLEATWKYLMMGSLGIGLALLGTFFLALAASSLGPGALVVDALISHARTLSRPWLKGAFIFMLVGYGTKMGLAPMHSWKPDAYGETPGVAGAVFASVITSCAFLSALRIFQVCAAAGLADFARGLFILIGFFSMGVAAVFVIGQKDFKRMLAYSSVEHMGILALGVGLGPIGCFFALLHLINNAIAKGVLFLSAGNIHRAFKDKTLDHVRGAIKIAPISASLFLLGFIAIAGSPPFGPFISEFGILRAALADGRRLAAGGFIVLSALIFIGMARTTISVIYGEPNEFQKEARWGDSPALVFAPLSLAALILILGLYIPGPLTSVLSRGSLLINGGAP